MNRPEAPEAGQPVRASDALRAAGISRHRLGLGPRRGGLDGIPATRGPLRPGRRPGVLHRLVVAAAAGVLLRCVPADAQAPACDVFANRYGCRLFTAEPPVAYASNRAATIEEECEAELPHVRGLGGRASLWWVWQAPKRGYAVVSTLDSDFDTLLGVYVGKDVCGFDLVGHNDDQAPGTPTSRVAFDAAPGEDYQIVVDGKNGQTGDVGLHIKLYTCPEIVAQPQSQPAAERRPVEFIVDALGANPLAYEWQHRSADGDGGFVPLAGETNRWLRFMVSTNRAGEYRVVITNDYCTVTSTPALLDVQSAPDITLPPVPGTNLACETRCFTVAAAGGLPLTNRWQFRPVAGADWVDVAEDVSFSGSATHCFPDLTTDQTGEYRVVISNAVGATNSAPATLLVLPWPPEITSDPASQLGFEREETTFAVGYGGPACEPTTFHWLQRPTNSPPGGAASLLVTDVPELHLPDLTADQAGYYSVIVSNRYGQSTPSREALLTLARRPPNDHLVNRIPILAVPATEHGWNRHATSELGEPGHAGSAARNSVWWAYQPPRLGVVSVDLEGSTLTSRIGVYTGPGFGQLATVTSGGRRVVFLGRPGEEYLIAVDGADGSEGDITLRLEFSDGSCPEWRSEPDGFQEIGDFGGGTGCRSRTLSGEAVSLTPVAYQWLFQGHPIAGATNNTLRLDNLATDDAGDYRLVAHNLACGLTSRVARVQVLVSPRILRDPVVVVTPLPLCTNRLRLEVEAESCRLPLTYQWRREGVAIPYATNAAFVIPSLDPGTAGAYDVVVSNPYGAAVSGVAVYEAELAPSVIVSPDRVEHPVCSDVLLQLATGECLDVTYQWRQNARPLPGAVHPALRLTKLSPAEVGDYDVVLAFGGTTLTSQVSQVRLLTPGLRREPELASYALCSPVRLSLDSADCQDAVRYQWRREGAAVPGETNAVLLLDPLTPAEAGHYDVVIALGANAVTSAVTEVTVAAAPVITRQPVAVTVTNCGPADFCVEVMPSPCAPPRFQWFSGPTGASATNLLPGATNPCLRLDRVTPEDAGAYLVEVRSPFATNISAAAWLNVLTAPRITLDPSPAFERVRAGQSFTNEVRAESCPSPLTFQWMRNDLPVVLDADHVLQSDGWLIVHHARVSDAGVYHCAVGNGLMNSVSRAVNIRVVVPPPNDDFAHRIQLSGTNLTATTYTDGTPYHNEMATAEPGETGLPGYPPSQTVWWTWAAPTPGRVTLDLSGSTSLSGGRFDTLLGVFQGDEPGALHLVAHDDNGGADGFSSRVSFLAAKGRTFHFAVDGKDGTEGYLWLRLVEQEIISPPFIEQQPYSVAAREGEDAIFSVEARGSPDLLYQWSKDGTAIPGATNATLVLPNVQPQDQGNYRVNIHNDYAPDTNSHLARLTLGTIMRGQVTDATNDRPVPGATVSAGGLSTVSDQNGNYELIGLEPGGLRADFDAESKRGDQVVVGLLDEVTFVDRSTLSALTLRCEKRPGFIDFEDSQFEPVRGRSMTNEISMSPVLTGMRYVLNWGREPADLDLVLVVKSPAGYWQVDYLWVGQGGSNTPPYVTFDVDARKGFGPETVTLHRLLPGTYQLYVRKFSENARGSLPTSGASVRVYESDPDGGASRLVGIREAPTEGTGNYWHLCDVDGETRVVRWRNALVSAPPEPGRALAHHEPAVGSTGSLPDPVWSVSATRHRQPALQGGGLVGVLYEWSLGDGAVRTNENLPVHAYAVPGCKDIQLRLRQLKDTGTIVSVTNKPCFVLVTNGPPAVAITSPAPHRLFRTGDPIRLDVQAADTDRHPAAQQITSVEWFRVEAGRTNLLTTLRAAPYTWTYTATDTPGPYVFIARATDNHGAATWSAPVPVETRDLHGEVLIIQNRAHPETDALLTLLSRPSIPRLPVDPGELITDLQVPEVRVLDQEGLYLDLVQDFRLIIWDDAGISEGGLQPNTVQVLLEAWQHGIPLYLIGQHLASAATAFTGPDAVRAAATWRELCRLAPADGEIEACEAVLQPPESLFNELFRTSWHGDVLPFRPPHPIERATVLADASQFEACDPAQPRRACLDDAQTRIACGAAPLLVRTPRIGQDSALRPLRLTQTFLVGGGDDEDARLQRETLFLNGVLWLLRNTCAQRGPAIEFPDGTHEQRQNTCEFLTVRALLSHHSECDEAGVLVSAAVPDGFQLCGVNVVSEPPEAAPTVLLEGTTVLFDFGLLRSGSHTLELTLRVCTPGVFTNRFELVSANRLPVTIEQAILVDGPACAACAPPVLDVVMATDGAVEVRVSQPPGCPARLEVSADLRAWQSVPDAGSPWVWRLPVANATGRFFRLSPVP